MKTKKHSLGVFTLLMLCAQTLSAYDFEADGFYFDIASATDLTVHVAEVPSGADKYHGDLTIPATVTHAGNTYRVTGIGNFAFQSCSELTSVVIPEGVDSIFSVAFDGCKKMTQVTIPESVAFFGAGAFRSCEKLASITIPDKVDTINVFTFNGCNALTEVSIGKGVKGIGPFAFYECPSLTEVSIGENVRSINSRAFSDCKSLKSVIIPNGVTYIEGDAFGYCTSLENVSLPNSLTYFTSEAFEGCTNLKFNERDNLLYLGDEENPCVALFKINVRWESIHEIDPNCKFIAKNAFQGCWSQLTHITIPSSIINIEENAFSEYYLETISVDPGNRVYDSRDNCNAVIETATNKLVVGCKGTIIPQNVTSIGRHAFSGCLSLFSISIPGNVTDIRYEAFKGCTYLRTVTMEEGVKSMEERVFQDCLWLKSLSVPNSIIRIGADVFDGCEYLPFKEQDKARYVGNEDNPYLALVGLKSKDITTCEINEDCKVIAIQAFSQCNDLTEVKISNSVKFIGSEAFAFCRNLRKVTMSDEVTDIGRHAFWYCTNLSYNEQDNALYLGNDENPFIALIQAKDQNITDCVISPNCQCVTEGAFQDCNNLSSITISDNVKNIGSDAFRYCTNLERICCNALVPPTCGSNTFEKNITQSCPLYVPAASLDAYKNAAVWKDFQSILANTNQTSIDDMRAVGTEAPYYTLRGSRIANPHAGNLYIQKGRKVLVK